MKKITLLLVFVALTVGCQKVRDLFEVDISKKRAELTSPFSGSWFPPGEVTFFWREVEGADSYHLMVVSGELVSPLKIMVDLVLTENYYTVSLPEGVYEWSVQPQNFGWKGLVSTRKINIGTPPPEKEPEEQQESESPEEGEQQEEPGENPDEGELQ